MSRKLLLWTFTVVLVAAACSDSAPEPTAGATTASTTTLAVTTTTPLATTTAPPITTSEPPSSDNPAAVAAEQFDTTGDDLVAAMQAWHELIRYFAQNPVGTPDEMVDLMYTPEFNQRDLLHERFAELVENDWRYIDPGTTLWGVKVVELDGDRAVVLEAIERGATTGGLQIVGDADGNEVKTYEGWELRIRELNLVREGPESRWRIDRVPAVDKTVEMSDLEVLEFDWIGEDV